MTVSVGQIVRERVKRAEAREKSGRVYGRTTVRDWPRDGYPVNEKWKPCYCSNCNGKLTLARVHPTFKEFPTS